MAKTLPQAEINYILGYPTYPIPLSPYLSHPLVHALHVGLGGGGAAAEGRRAIYGAWGNFEAILKRFRSDFEPFSGGFIEILSVLGSPGTISRHHTSLETLPGRLKTISHFAYPDPNPTQIKPPNWDIPLISRDNINTVP